MFAFEGRSEVNLGKKLNEDAIDGFTINDTLFMVLADGFGLKNINNINNINPFTGEIDALATTDNENKDELSIGKIVVDEIRGFINELYTSEIKGNDSKKFLTYTINKTMYFANRIVKNLQKVNKDFGCSLIICGILPTREMVFSHVGVNRLYIIRNGNIFVGTEDDNEANVLLKENKITKEEYETHELRAKIINGLGISDIPNPYEGDIILAQNDLVLLTSDGTYGALGDEKLKNLILEANKLDTACDWVIKGIKEVGVFDDHSIILAYMN